MTNKKYISSQLREARSKTGLSQEAYSKKIKMAKRLITDLESEKANPTLESLETLAKGMGKKLAIRFE